MEFKLAIAQCAHRHDGDALALVEDWTARAKAQGADMVVFPECLMTPFEREPEDFARSAQPADGEFATAVDAIAAERGIVVVYTINERNPEGGRPYNTAVVTDARGSRLGSYRKVHLFESGRYHESEKMSPGSAVFEPVDTGLCRLGLGICYDLRFPELARKQALAGCELIVYPAAWVAGPGKLGQWQTLLRARAIENGVFVAGVCRSGSDCTGGSLVAGPSGDAIVQAGDGEELLVCSIDTGEVAEMHRNMPTLEHVRPELY